MFQVTLCRIILKTHTHTSTGQKKRGAVSCNQESIIKSRASTHSSGFLVDLHVKPEIEKSESIRHQQQPGDDKHKNKQNQAENRREETERCFLISATGRNATERRTGQREKACTCSVMMGWTAGRPGGVYSFEDGEGSFTTRNHRFTDPDWCFSHNHHRPAWLWRTGPVLEDEPSPWTAMDARHQII